MAARDPQIAFKIGDDGSMIVLSAGGRRVLCRALLLYAVDQHRRIVEAIDEGNLGHADARARRLRACEDLIEFFRGCGVPYVADYWRKTIGALPSRCVQVPKEKDHA